MNIAKVLLTVCSVFGTIGAGLQAQTLTTIHSFVATDGLYPSVALVQGANGDLYGTTFCGGSGGVVSCGAANAAGGAARSSK
jgi:hypothetical protein